jgi:hypothetical protein
MLLIVFFFFCVVAANGVVIATEKKLPSILVDESSVSKLNMIFFLSLLYSLVKPFNFFPFLIVFSI